MVGAVGVEGWKQIVGVVGDTRHGGLGGWASPEIYWPFEALRSAGTGLHDSHRADPAKMVLPLRKVVQAPMRPA